MMHDIAKLSVPEMKIMPREEEGPFGEPLVSVPTSFADWRVPAHEAVRRMAISTNAGPDYVKDTFGGDIANAPADRAEAVRQVVERQRTDGQRLADYFDAMPEVAVVEQIERDGETWLLYATNGPIAFPLTDALIERQSHLIGNLPGKDGVSDYTRLMTGEAIHVSWRVEHKDGVVTKLEVMLDGKVFVPNWDAAQMDELKKTQPTVETKPETVEFFKPHRNLKVSMEAFKRMAGNLIGDQPTAVLDNIRHMASNGVSWATLDDAATNWGDLLAATRKIMETDIWKDDPDGSRREFQQITEERELPIGKNEPEQVVSISKEKKSVSDKSTSAWTVVKINGATLHVTAYADQTAEDVKNACFALLDGLGQVLTAERTKSFGFVADGRDNNVTWIKQPAEQAQHSAPPPIPFPQQTAPQQQTPPPPPRPQPAPGTVLSEKIVKVKREYNGQAKTPYYFTGLYTNFGTGPGKFATYQVKDDSSGFLNTLTTLTGKQWYNEQLGSELPVDFMAEYTLSAKLNSKGEPYHDLARILVPAPVGSGNPNEPF